MFEIGSSLRDARTRQGLDLLDLERDTKIRAKYLRALEEEHFEVLPGDAYTKGFLRTYAERLGLDGQLYVDEYNSRFSDASEPLFAARPRQHAHRRLESHAVLIALAGIVVVTVLVIAAWQLGESTPQDGGTIVTKTEPLPATSPEAGPSQETVPAEPGDVSGTSLSIDADSRISNIEVHQGSARGDVLFAGALPPGQTRTFEGAAKRYWIRTSDLEHLTLIVNEIRYDSLGGPGPATILVTANGPRVVSSP